MVFILKKKLDDELILKRSFGRGDTYNFYYPCFLKRFKAIEFKRQGWFRRSYS